MIRQASLLEAPIDILVGTPQKVTQHAEKGHLFYGDVEVPQPHLDHTSGAPQPVDVGIQSPQKLQIRS